MFCIFSMNIHPDQLYFLPKAEYLIGDLISYVWMLNGKHLFSAFLVISHFKDFIIQVTFPHSHTASMAIRGNFPGLRLAQGRFGMPTEGAEDWTSLTFRLVAHTLFSSAGIFITLIMHKGIYYLSCVFCDHNVYIMDSPSFFVISKDQCSVHLISKSIKYTLYMQYNILHISLFHYLSGCT